MGKKSFSKHPLKTSKLISNIFARSPPWPAAPARYMTQHSTGPVHINQERQYWRNLRKLKTIISCGIINRLHYNQNLDRKIMHVTISLQFSAILAREKLSMRSNKNSWKICCIQEIFCYVFSISFLEWLKMLWLLKKMKNKKQDIIITRRDKSLTERGWDCHKDDP